MKKRTRGAYRAKGTVVKVRGESELKLLPSEARARERRCRDCGKPVERNSYWYCVEHNILLVEDDEAEYKLLGDICLY